MIATDATDIKTRSVESIIVQSGERYDFWIEARDPILAGNYWIRAETLEYYHNGRVNKVYFINS